MSGEPDRNTKKWRVEREVERKRKTETDRQREEEINIIDTGTPRDSDSETIIQTYRETKDLQIDKLIAGQIHGQTCSSQISRQTGEGWMVRCKDREKEGHKLRMKW